MKRKERYRRFSPALAESTTGAVGFAIKRYAEKRGSRVRSQIRHPRTQKEREDEEEQEYTHRSRNRCRCPPESDEHSGVHRFQSPRIRV
ncbi:hypothetical protein ACLB2K_045304 [Fragaria x ananassa]